MDEETPEPVTSLLNTTRFAASLPLKAPIENGWMNIAHSLGQLEEGVHLSLRARDRSDHHGQVQRILSLDLLRGVYYKHCNLTQ